MKNHFPSQEMPATKLKLLNSGIELMRLKGFNATSVGEICEAAGTTKGGFFHYFASKEDIVKEAATLFREEKVRAYQAAGFMDLPDPLDRVYGRLEYLKSSERTRTIYSCLIGTLAQEVSTTHPELRAIFQNAFAKMTQDLETDLTAAKALHAPHASFDPAALASMFISMFQGSLMVAKAEGTNAVIVGNIDGFIACLKSFFAAAEAKPKAATKRAKVSR